MTMVPFDPTKPAFEDDRISADVRNDLDALFNGDHSPLRARAQASPNMTVAVNGTDVESFWRQIWMSAALPLDYAGGNSPTITGPPVASNPRIALLTIDSAGTLAWTYGDQAVSPTPPNTPSGKIPICWVYQRYGMSKIVNYEVQASYPSDGYIYRDVRPFVNFGSSAGKSQSQVFTSNGTFNVPAGVLLLWVTLVAPGGGGGGGGASNGASNPGAGGGGGGGGETLYRIPITPSALEAISVALGTVGSAGAAGSGGAGGDGGDGGDSTFGSYLTAKGGKKGLGAAYGGTPSSGAGGNGGGVKGGAGAAGVTSDGGDGTEGTQYQTGSGGSGGGAGGGKVHQGGAGGANQRFAGGLGGAGSAGTGGGGGGGGATFYGPGGDGGDGGNTTVGEDGSAPASGYGGGGGAGGGGDTNAQDGGAGGPGKAGFCLVEWMA